MIDFSGIKLQSCDILMEVYIFLLRIEIKYRNLVNIKSAFSLFHSIIAASVSGNPAPKPKKKIKKKK